MSVTDSAESRKPLSTPPGPANPVTTTVRFQRSPLDFTAKLIATYGDICTFRLANTRIVMLSHPRHIKHILQRRPSNYVRATAAHKMARMLFGNGIPTMEGGDDGGVWWSRRRLMKPSFHYQRVGAMSGHMTAVITSVLDRWQHAGGQPIDAGVQMRQLTLRVVARALFGLTDEATIRRFADAVDIVDHELAAYMRFPLVPLKVPTAGHRRFWDNRAVLDAVIDETIAAHRDEVDRADLLSILMRTEDEDTGKRLSHAELRDESLAFLFAGHETSANVLTWAFYRLGLHLDVQDRVRAEVDHVLGNQAPTFADTTRLPYTRQVLDETMRLYPQQWQGWRSTVADDVIGDDVTGRFRIPAGTDIFYSPYHAHRHPAIWANPESFQPSRFTPEAAAQRDASTYMPFGRGPHVCIGQQFALTEMLLVVASAIQRFHLDLVERTTIAPQPLVTLGPARPVLMHLRTRH